MKASAACLDLIKALEGFSAKPYRCPAGIPTIGYGVTKYPDGRSVAINDLAVTEDEAHELLVTTLVPYESVVERLVHVPLSQSQFDALVSFTFNLGATNLSNSTLLRVLNAGDYAAAAKEFSRWVYCNGELLPGLAIRREAEKALFLSMAPPDETSIKKIRRRVEDALRKVATYEDLLQIARILKVKLQ